jgi:hypothetical protein
MFMKIHEFFPLLGTNTSRQVNFDNDEDLLSVVRNLVNGWRASENAGVAKADPGALKAGVEAYIKGLEDSAGRLFKVKINVKVCTKKATETAPAEFEYQDRNVEFTGADVLVEARLRFMPKGTIRVPTKRAVFAHRRTSAIDYVNAILARLQLPKIEEIPVVDLSGLSEAELHERNVRENLDRTAAKAMGPVDNYRAASLLYSEGANQSTIRHIFGDGNGQKLFKLLTIVQADREAALKPENKDKGYGKLDSEVMTGKVDLAKLGQGGKDHPAKAAADALAAGEISLDEALDKVRNPAVVGGNKPKAVKMEDQVTLAKQSPVLLVRYVVSSLVLGKKENIVKLNASQVALNEAWSKLGLEIPEIKS